MGTPDDIVDEYRQEHREATKQGTKYCLISGNAANVIGAAPNASPAFVNLSYFPHIANLLADMKEGTDKILRSDPNDGSSNVIRGWGIMGSELSNVIVSLFERSASSLTFRIECLAYKMFEHSLEHDQGTAYIYSPPM
ncbi:hypothetical protein ACVWZZ_003344 [Bradyrhizobium sp. LM6.10]